MKFLADFLPVFLFFIAFYIAKTLGYNEVDSLLIGIGVIIPASIAQFIYFYRSGKKIERMHKINLALILGFGLISLLIALNSSAENAVLFFKWKVSVLNWLFALVFLGSQFIGEKNLIERMMAHAIEVPKPIWRRLNTMWVSFFLFVGFVNLYVMYNFSEEFWVNFKLFGLIGLTLLFLVIQGIYLARHMTEEEAADESPSK